MRDRLASETGEEREARLQQRRDRLASDWRREGGQASADEGPTGSYYAHANFDLVGINSG